MPITYNSLVSEVASVTAITSSVLVNGDNNFAGIMDAAINHAEGRLYRDLDLPAVRVVDTSVTTSSGVRSVSLSTTQGTLLAIEAFNIFVPAGATSSYATRIPLVPTSQAVVDAVYPSATSSNTAQPQYFSRITDTLIIFGPTPDQGYGTEVTATTRPPALSASNSSTWLTQNVPELMLAATMVFMAGYMRDFGSQSDNPQLAQSWESQYSTLMKSADVDSLRQKFQSQAWTSQIPNQVATPPRA